MTVDRLRITCAVLAAAALLVSPMAAAEPPSTIAHQGRLIDASGQPIQGQVQLSVSLWDDMTEGASLWSETETVTVDAGYYATELGDSVPLDALVFDAAELWIEHSVDGVALPPRQRISATPWSLRAAESEQVVGGVRLDANGASRPACDASTRGTVWVQRGDSGEADAAHLCAKDAADEHAWVPLWAPFDAVGGTIVDVGEYRIHAFTTVGTHSLQVMSGTRQADVLVVGGGGGGGSTWGGGGGAGGLVFAPTVPLAAGRYSVTIGGGGAGIPASGVSIVGNDGSPSRFAHLFAHGGGGGGSVAENAARAGGSGGSSSVSTAGGAALQPNSVSGGYGNPGASSASGGANDSANGGGGGAGAPGQSLGLGGVGLFEVGLDGQTYNFGQLFGSFGHQVSGQSWFAGGGVGGCKITSQVNVINGGGGGATPNAASPRRGFDAIPNTGGGGGGQCTSHSGTGTGGSGIVLVRYRR